jgi:cysteinyl-tRNA synthetase
MHITHLIVDRAKMSKSLGNMYTLNDIEKAGFSADVLRCCLISGHYRQPLNFAINGLNAAASALKKLAKYGEILEPELPQYAKSWTFLGQTYEALLSDLNVPLCPGCVFPFFGNLDAKGLNSGQKAALAEKFFSPKYALGLRLEREAIFSPDHIRELANTQWEAKSRRNYALADELRMQAEASG